MGIVFECKKSSVHPFSRILLPSSETRQENGNEASFCGCLKAPSLKESQWNFTVLVKMLEFGDRQIVNAAKETLYVTQGQGEGKRKRKELKQDMSNTLAQASFYYVIVYVVESK